MPDTPDLPAIPYRPTIPVILRRAAELFGADDFIVLPDRRITFAQVEAASRRLAKQLLAAGAGKGTRIGIALPTGVEWAAAFLAVTRIGAIAMPYSTVYRPAELRTALRAGDVSILVSAPTILGKDHEAFLEEAIPGLAGASPGALRVPELPHLRSVRLVGDSRRPWAEPFDLRPDGAADVIDGFDDDFLGAVEKQVCPGDELVVVFTSGTSAEPKAVVHTQGAALRKTSPVADAALNAIFGGRVLCLMPFFWVGGMQEVLAALHTGAAVITLERLEAGAALELGRREKATSLMGNPQNLRSLLAGVDITTMVPTLRSVPRRPWEGPPSSQGVPALPIGMTETFGAWSSVPGIECRVVDPETGSLLPEGSTGEFQLRGYGLMRGLYKHEREETFTRDGFFATGDLGYTENGYYYFVARSKEMIKVKGANVAPAEVESVLNACPEVRMSFVIGLPHAEHGEQVVAGVVPEAGQVVDVEELRARCRRLLSSYKVPGRIEVLAEDEVPILASSKPDRRAIGRLLAERESVLIVPGPAVP